MTSLRNFVGTLFLVIIFVLLSLFSVIEYRNGKASTEQKDKSNLVNEVFSKIVNTFAYLEKMPLLRLLPATKMANNYGGTMNDLLEDKMVVQGKNSLMSAKNKQKVKIINSLDKNEEGVIGYLQTYWLTLKDQMIQKDWSRL